MNRHKYYLQTDIEHLEYTEKKFDFIPDLTNHAAARSLDKLCLCKTAEICKQRTLGKDSRKSEKQLSDYRNYAFRHYGK